MEPIELRIPGAPQGKGRARSMTLRTGQKIHYTPEKTRTYEGVIKSLAMDVMGECAPLDGPLQLELICTYPMAASWPAWKRELALSGQLAATVKPDADNVAKAVKDALNGVVWGDDTQVVRAVITKVYGERPMVAVRVTRLPQHSAQIKRRPGAAA